MQKHTGKAEQQRFIQRKDNKETSLKDRQKRCRENLKRQLYLSSPEEDTDTKDKNSCDDKGKDDTETHRKKCSICKE
jgi:hypothetical protein